MRISDWSSDVCSSDLPLGLGLRLRCNGFLDAALGQPAFLLQPLPKLIQLHRGVAPEVEIVPGLPEIGGAAIAPAPCARVQIGRASCRERVCQYGYISVVAVSLQKKNIQTTPQE